MSRNRKPKSPYARHAKAPYKYSEAYRRWREATSEEDRIAADRAFRRLWGIPTWIIDPISGRVLNFPRRLRPVTAGSSSHFTRPPTSRTWA